jgi:predicted flap endonuclease-1-like 5' DNA nuclease
MFSLDPRSSGDCPFASNFFQEAANVRRAEIETAEHLLPGDMRVWRDMLFAAALSTTFAYK